MARAATEPTRAGSGTIPNFIFGAWTPSASHQTLPVTDPGTGELPGHALLSNRGADPRAVA